MKHRITNASAQRITKRLAKRMAANPVAFRLDYTLLKAELAEEGLYDFPSRHMAQLALYWRDHPDQAGHVHMMARLIEGLTFEIAHHRDAFQGLATLLEHCNERSGVDRMWRPEWERKQREEDAA